MELFESAWKDGFKFFKREFNKETKKSSKVEIKTKYEWYIPLSTGKYEFILDPTIKLEKIESFDVRRGRDEYGFLDPIYKNIRENHWNKDLYNQNPHIWYLDIETRSGQVSKGFPVPEKAAEQVSLIQIFDNYNETMFIIGLKDWKHENDFEFNYKVKYLKCTDEVHLFKVFFELFKRLDPLIVYAWNGSRFDFPYLMNRSTKLGFELKNFSNYGNSYITEKEFNGNIEFKIKIDGHFFLDLMDVYKTFVYKARSSYSLDNISQLELGKTKIQHTEYAAFDDFYTGKYIIPLKPTDEQKNSKIYNEAINGNWDEVKELAHSEFVYYGATDTYLIKMIDDKLKFTSLLTMIADKMGVLISDTMSTVKPWTHFIGNRAIQNNKVMPPRKERDDSPHIVGGYVRDPQIGKQKWVISADVNSMYPLLGMVGFNNSPETFVAINKLEPDLRDIILTYFNDQDEARRFEIPEDKWLLTEELLKKYNLSLGINGALFTRDFKGMIPELVQEIYDTRKDFKKIMFKYQQQKVLINEILKEKIV
jgi:DNA polymerase elongation subunit (family B)